MHAFYCEELNRVGQVVSLEKTESDHLFKTLRAKIGEVVKLLDGNGKVAMAEVVENKQLVINELNEFERPKCKIGLIIAAPRKQKLDQVLKQATELGVDFIGIMHCEYSVALPMKSDRWESILWEACKQSNNPFLPKILPVMKFSEAVEFIENENLIGVFGDVEENITNISADDKQSEFCFIVGPEGGFSSSELEILKKKNFLGLNLGPYILRLETAAICGIAVIRKLLGGK